MFQIFVDSAANLPAVIAKKYNIHVISFVNLILGKEVTCYNRLKKNARRVQSIIMPCVRVARLKRG